MKRFPLTSEERSMLSLRLFALASFVFVGLLGAPTARADWMHGPDIGVYDSSPTNGTDGRHNALRR